VSGGESRRIATLDIGTNTVLLLVADATPSGLAPVIERATITRLGEGVDRTRELSAAARTRTLECLESYARTLAELGVTRVAAVGTSALRDARGGVAFAREVEHVLGTAPEVIDGEREATLTFRGALSGLAVSGPVTVFDVGGGSTEIVRGSAERAVLSAASLDVGSVRLFERHVRSDPAASREIQSVRDDVAAALTAVERPAPGQPIVGVAGTVTTLAAIALELDDYDPSRVHGHVLEGPVIRSIGERLARMPLDERRGVTGLDPRRADVIVVGALIVEEVLAFSGSENLIVSDRGVRWGLAEELAAAAPDLSR
jgi:exopolyphosphatase/guanosine-5'-triphosphate,3'-diphosphate pyrophosphatase